MCRMENLNNLKNLARRPRTIAAPGQHAADPEASFRCQRSTCRGRSTSRSHTCE